MRRRTLLRAGLAGLLALPAAHRPAAAQAVRRIALRHAATGAAFAGIWHLGGLPDPVAMRELSAALADPGCPPHPFDPAAIELLWEVATRARLGPELTILSGFRTPAVNRAVRGVGDSQHLRAGAMDLLVPQGRLAVVVEAAMRLNRGGVGVYPQRGFVHLDSGPARHWTSGGLSGGGRAAAPEDRIGRIAAAWGQVSGR